MLVDIKKLLMIKFNFIEEDILFCYGEMKEE